MEKREFNIIFDCLMKLDGALISLLGMNWAKYPWAKDGYKELSGIYEKLRKNACSDMFMDKIEG